MSAPNQPVIPELAGEGIAGGIYTPVNPLPYDNDVAVPDTTDSASLDNINEPDVDQKTTEEPNAGTNSYPPAFDGGDIQEQTPGHHEADQNMEYDQGEVDRM